MASPASLSLAGGHETTVVEHTDQHNHYPDLHRPPLQLPLVDNLCFLCLSHRIPGNSAGPGGLSWLVSVRVPCLLSEEMNTDRVSYSARERLGKRENN